MRSEKRIIIIVSTLLLLVASQGLAQEKIKIGVSTALTGNASSFGIDIKNSLILMNEKIGKGRYELVFEDDKCENRAAVTAAQKLINIDKVRYVLGFPCNQTLMATAPIYERAGVLVLTSSATSGDVPDIGKNIFRLFPSDTTAAKLLYKNIANDNSTLGILTEQNEYTLMMERTMREENRLAGGNLNIQSSEFTFGDTDLRAVILRTISNKPEAFFVNANDDSSFIAVVKQLRALKYTGKLYAAYLPASATVLENLKSEVNGFIFSNLPQTEDLMTEKGKTLMLEYKNRFGAPLSGFPVVPISFEAFNTLDLAIQDGGNPRDFLLATKFKGEFIPSFYFEKHGSVQGINFVMQKIKDGKVVTIN